jgi:hypothetical protein
MINKVILTDEQKKKAWELGTARNEAKPSGIRENDSGYHNNNDDRAHPHRLGIAAEIAYSHITGKQLDERVMANGDVTDFDGIEIKAATWLGEDIELKVKREEYKEKNPKCYLLARVAENLSFVEFIGCVSRSRFDKEKYFRKHKFVPNYCMEGKDLKKAMPVYNGTNLDLLPFEDFT